MKSILLFLFLCPLCAYPISRAPADLWRISPSSYFWINSILKLSFSVKNEMPNTSPEKPAPQSKCNSIECPKEPLRLSYSIYGVLSCIFFLLFLNLIRKKSLLSILDSKKIKRPNLLTFSYRLHSLKTPSDGNALLWISFLLFCIWAGAFLMSFCDDGYKDTVSDFVAIQASTLALLFPLVVLIIDKKDESFLNVVSSKEVLLHYAWAFPASLALPIISSFYMVDGHKVWSLFLTATSVSIALFVLYRLLKITFSLKTWKDEETKLLSRKIQLITAEDLADAFADGALPKQLKEFYPHISYQAYFSESLLERKQEYEIIYVKPSKTGILSYIDKDQILQVFKKLKSTSPGGDQVNQFFLSVCPGSSLEKDKTRVGVLAIKKSEYDKSTANWILEKINNALHIQSDGISSSTQFETLFSRLAQAGKSAIESNNIEVLTSLKETYIFIYGEAINILESNSEYLKDSEDPRKTESFGKSSSPFELIVHRLRQLSQEAFSSSLITNETLHHVAYFPWALCFEAIEKKDMICFRRFIAIASHQSYHAFSSKKPKDAWSHIISWLGSILDYHLDIESQITKGLDFDKSIKYEILFPSLREFQNLIRYAIDANLGSVAIDAYNRLEEALNLFKFEDLESEISLQKSYLNILKGEDKANAEKNLDMLKSKLHIKNIAKYYCWTTLMAVCGYILYNTESKDLVVTKEDERGLLFQNFMSRLPDSFREVFEFYLFFKRDINTIEWQWSHWETHPLNQVYHTSTDANIERLFSILFARSAHSLDENFSVSEYKLNPQKVFSLRRDGNIRRFWNQEPSNIESYLGISTKLEDTTFKKLNSILDALIDEAQLQANFALAQKPISQLHVSKFKEDVCSGFRKTSLFRSKINVLYKENFANNENWLGIKIYSDKEAFVSDSNVDFGRYGKEYGESLARGEDELILKSLLDTVASENHKNSLDEVLKTACELKIDFSKFTILGGYHALKSLIVNTENFVPKYKLNSTTDPGEDRLGTFVFNGLEIPIYMIRSQKTELKDCVVILNPKNITLALAEVRSDVDCLSQLAIQVFVKDPGQLPDLLADLVKQDFEYLKGHDIPTRQKIAATKVLLEIFENLHIEIQKSNEVFKVSMPKSQEYIEEGT